MAVLPRTTPSTARIDPVIRCRWRMFVATTCVRMLTSPGSGAHRDDSWHRQEVCQDGGVGLADPQGHERDELAAEGAEVKALADGFERAVSGESRSRAWTARNPARASRSASVKGLQSTLAQPGDKRGAEPAALPGIDHGYPASAVPGWSGGKRHGPFGLFRNGAWYLSPAPGPALAGAA
jgi:hypothetical protein